MTPMLDYLFKKLFIYLFNQERGDDKPYGSHTITSSKIADDG